MQRDRRKHVVLDTNIILAYLSEKLSDDVRLVERARMLIESVTECEWPLLRLYIPSLCIGEAQAILDRYRFCDWHGRLKQKPLSKLTKKEHRECTKKLSMFVDERKLDRIEIDHRNILTSSLVSPVNAKYQIQRKRNRTAGAGKRQHKIVPKPPMGGIDCIIAGVAIELATRVGAQDVVLATDDRRLYNVVRKCRTLSRDKAESLGLIETARSIGLEWGTQLYPTPLRLSVARQAELEACFFGWPLPEKKVVHKSCSDLTDRQAARLWELALEVKEVRRVGPDSLPYTAALDYLQTRFAHERHVYVPQSEIARQLLAWRKNPKSRPVEPQD